MSKQFYRGYFFTEGRALKVGLKASVNSDLILPQGVRVGMGQGEDTQQTLKQWPRYKNQQIMSFTCV